MPQQAGSGARPARFFKDMGFCILTQKLHTTRQYKGGCVYTYRVMWSPYSACAEEFLFFLKVFSPELQDCRLICTSLPRIA